MGCVLSQPNEQHHSSQQYTIKKSNNKQSSTKKGLVKTKTQTRSSTLQLTSPAPAAVTRQSSPAPLQLRSQPSTTSPTPSIERITPTPSASKHEIAYEFTVEQPETLTSTQGNYPRIDLTLIPSDPIRPDHLILPTITPSITPTSDITSSTSPTSTMLGMESRRPNLIISTTSTSTSTSTSTRETPTLARPLSITTTTSHETTLKLPAINTSTSSSTSTSPSLSIATGTSTSTSPSLSITTGTSTSPPPSITTDSPRRIGPLTLQPLSTSTSTSSLSSSRPSLSRPGSADRSARHHHLPPPTPSHFTPHVTVPDTPSFCSPRNAHAKSFFGASASKPPGFSRPSSASSRTTISQRVTVTTESESSSESEEAEEESSDDEEEEEEEVFDENAPPPVKSSISSSPASQISLDGTDDHDDDPPVFKSVAHLRIDPAAEPCATVIKPPLRRMCRARHVVWDASPEAAHAAYQPPSEILPFLYLGCYDNVYDTPVKSEAKLREMQSLGLSHILTVATECATPYQQFQYLKISIQDDVRSHIHPHFTEAFDFIDQARDRGGKCIVHCWAGVSRSATIVIGYLIARCGMRFDVAHAHVRERRPIVHPNISFREALLNLDACVHEPERYKASQQEVIAMLSDSDAATMRMDREVMCGDRKLWGVPIHTLKR